MAGWRVLLTFGFVVGPAFTCTIVNQPTPQEALKIATVVFRGTVLKSEVLRPHPERKGRERFAFTVRVSEYWKGNRGETVTLYDLAPGTDCMGAGLRVGKEYLIFALEEGARDNHPDPDFFWYGWTDVLPPGTLMLQPLATLGGDLSVPLVRNNMRHLGRGEEASPIVFVCLTRRG